MSSSLRDQLIQAGLGTAKQTRQAPPQPRARSRHEAQPVSEEKLAAQRAQAAKSARDQELNRLQQERSAAKARRAQAKQLIEQSRLPPLESDEYFYFADGKRLRRIAVNARLRSQLAQGAIAVVRYERHYALVPEAAVAKIRERDEHAIVPYQAAASAADQEDAYKDFAVPDDLVW